MISDASARWSTFSRRLSQRQLDFPDQAPIFIIHCWRVSRRCPDQEQEKQEEQEDHQGRQPVEDSYLSTKRHSGFQKSEDDAMTKPHRSLAISISPVAFRKFRAPIRRIESLALSLALCTLGLGLSGSAHAQTITPFEAPGAGTLPGQGTEAIDINLAGAVVGIYADSNNVAHGFVCVSGCASPHTFTNFEAPDAGTTDNGSGCLAADSCQGTYAFSVSPFGIITGFYNDTNNTGHGFVTGPPYTTFTALNDPDAGQGSGQGTFAEDINLEGEIAGSYIDASGVSHGFVTAPPYTTFTSFDPAGSVDTFLPAGIGINLEGAITGVYVDASGVFHGFLRAPNGTITVYNVTGGGTAAGQGTNTSGINDLGTIMGPYIDANGVDHGYVRSPNGDITTFNVAGAGTGAGQGTVPEGNNLDGEITGQYIDASGVNHGFVRSRFGAITTFDAPGAGTAAGQGTIPLTPNMFGVITGEYLDANGVLHGFLRTP
jgi:hypothetical protein